MNPVVARSVAAAILAISSAPLIHAHVTLRTSAPLVPAGYGTVMLSVPTERAVDTSRVVLEVPDDFLRAGGRISRLEYPPGWTIALEKQDIPGEIYADEAAARKQRRAEAAATEHAAPSDAADVQSEEAAMEELRRKWIKRVTFEGGAIPPDGFAEFRLSVLVPREPGRYRFPATQVYADGKEVGWTQLVEGAPRPAPMLIVERRSPYTAYLWPAVSVLALVTSFVALLKRRPMKTASA
jgi:uncharacterized protein YcnI